MIMNRWKLKTVNLNIESRHMKRLTDGSSLVLAILVVCAADFAELQCPNTLQGTYRHPTDCGKYYECSNGVAVEMNCPAGLQFNADLIPCDRPKTANCKIADVVEVTSEPQSVAASFLFLLDESDDVGLANFQLTKDFVRTIITRYPLSAIRSAGVITFSSDSTLRIPLGEDNTEEFMSMLDAIPYRGGGTDILSALEMAYDEIQTHAVHSLTLVILLMDGESETDGTPAADKIKAANQPIFTIGFGSTRIVQLKQIASEGPDHLKNFFHASDYSLVKIIGEYLNPSAEPIEVQTTSFKCI